MRGHEGAVCAVAFTPDGRELVTAGTDLQLWDAASQEMIHEPLSCDGQQVRSVTFSSDGTRSSSRPRARRHVERPIGTAVASSACGTPPPGARSLYFPASIRAPSPPPLWHPTAASTRQAAQTEC
ncbi:WD40 repeat domain-containing protein [Streptomyces sp. WMMC1477]|uniref:WD40 repeat domain-containing protein n=1 Tax=Streptomyces sp. WMMC1477 TaxID=3015155 RepID=UPI003FCCD302